MGKIAQKREKVEALKEKFANIKIAIVTDFKGISVKEISDLRRRLTKDEAEIKIAKNTLIKHAIKETNLSELDSLLKGPSAVLIGYGEPSGPAKILFDFIKEIEKGDVKGGVFDGKLYSKKDLMQIANLPSREVLLSQIAGLLVAPARDIAGILEGIIRDNALLIEEVAKKNEKKAA